METEKKWFESWFDTRYYHLLYRNRDDSEARMFIDRILDEIQFEQDAELLDLACGKGRHAIYLAEKGYTVTGFDLSPSNIETANKDAHAKLRFEIRDMRENLGKESFDGIFNLFTGFGYFESDEENFSVFNSIYDALKPGGLFIFDYLNEPYVRQLKTEKETFEIEGIQFTTHKEFSGRKVIKHIAVKDGSQVYQYAEQVSMYGEKELAAVLKNLGFSIQKTYGDYTLNEYAEASARLIITAKKVKA